MAVIAKSLSAKKRSGAAINVYLLLRKGETVLLSLRKNTGYFDGCYGFVSGHVEDGESASAAMIREAREEADLILSLGSLKAIHFMHRKTNRFNVDIFFECANWERGPVNLEPNKCAELGFFSLKTLPDNLVPYVGQALHFISQGVFYSEVGWAF